MKKMIFLCAALCTITSAIAQNKFYTLIKDKETKAVLPGATISIKNTAIVVISDKNGIAEIQNIPAGAQQITAEHIGYVSEKRELKFPLNVSDTLEILLTEDHQELDEIMVQSTRTSRSIANTPTRLEVIDAEELDEKSNMRPSNVSMVLHESTGLQVQQTSATSGNASIRVQGLDGKYTQLLKDGYPNFGNFASGLSILEIPPLDLKQVEIIKGPSSTLYGGGAIAGVINFISKTPTEKGEYNFILNQSNVGQTNTGLFAAHKKGKWGYSILGSFNWQKAYDVDKDGFSELPKSNNFTVNPTLFFYPDKTSTFIIGNSFTKGKNTGGDMQVIKNNADANHVYFEENETIRNTTTLSFEKKFENRQSLKIKQSLSFFDRKINIPAYSFAGLNTNTYTDASYIFYAKTHSIVTGINFIYDKFHQKENSIGINQDAKTVTDGIYAQDTWDITDKNKIEYGVRVDNV
ncbi:MAG: TonB-dependent receptor, partial [Ferruginibacter sp.]